MSPSDFLAGEQTIAASYTATATVEGVTFSLAGTLKFKMAEIFTIYNSMELEHDYNNVTIAGSEIEVDLGGYTAQVLTVTGNDVTLKNGTIIDLTIAEGVENVTLEDIKDNEAGTWIFAGGGSGSIVLRGSTAPKGTVVITSPTPIEIRSESGESEISGNVIIETVARVIIDTPVQGDIEVRAASESITVKRPVKKITAFFKTCIRIDHRLSQSERPKLEKPAAVVASAVLIDDDEDEIENVEFEDNEDLSQPEAIIVSIEKIIVEVKPGDPYSLPAQVEVIYSDGTLGYKAVAWSPTTVDTSEKGTFTFVGTVEDYAGIAQLILRVKADETFYDLTYTAGENGSIQGDTNQSVKHGESGSQVEAKAAINYHFVKWSDGSTDNPRIDTNITADVDVQALFAIDKYTVIFLDWDGETLAKERIPHGGSATAPTVPEKEGYTFTGWDKEFDKVTSDLTVTALYDYDELMILGEMIAEADERARPGYTFVADTHTEQDWDQYWGDFEGALNAAKQTQGNLIEKHPLTEEDEGVVATAIQDLQRAVEILDGIEDFDDALGDREDPKGLVETVYDCSLRPLGDFPAGRMRCYYEKDTANVYWMLSEYVKEQDLYDGTRGTGMNPGLQNVMLSDSITKLRSGSRTVNIYKEDGTRRTKKELEGEGIKLAISWLKENGIDDWYYYGMVGLVIDCELIGETSDGTEFERTYTFHFIDGGVHLFDSNYRYCVIDGVVRISGHNVLTYSAEENGTVEGGLEQIVEHGEDGAPVTAVPNPGYHFVKWSDGSTENPRTDTNVTGYISVTAEFAADGYTVTFDAQEGTVEPETKQVTYDSAYGDLPTPDRIGYSFIGWFTDETGGTEVEADTTVAETSNHSLYARWLPNEDTAYKIEHYQQGVDGDGYALRDTEEKTGPTGKNVEAQAKDYPGFTENTNHESRVASGDIAADGSLVLKLYYDRETYTVSFNSNGGGDVADITDIRYEATITAPTAPEKQGYTFGGWFKEADLNNEWIFASDQVMEATTLYAKWNANTGTAYKVEHYQQDVTGDGYTLVEDDTESLTGTTAETATASAKDYTGFSENENHSSRIASGAIAADGGLVLRLYYDRDTFTVNFESNGGDDVASIGNVRYEATITEPTAPEKQGYSFAGWFKEADLNNEWIFASDQVKADTTLYAKWEPTAVTCVEILIAALPDASTLNLDDLDDVEAAEAAYNNLSTEEQGEVSSADVNKLNAATNEIEQLVLKDVDRRFNEAKEDLLYEDTGIERVEYVNRTATFFIDDPYEKVFAFVSSGVTDVFEAMFQDVSWMKLNNNHCYELEGDYFGGLEAGARLVLVLLGHDEYIENPFEHTSELMNLNMSDLQGKQVDIQLAIKPGIKDYIGSYVVEFKGIDCTVNITAHEGGVTGGGTYEIGSEVEITVTPPEGKEIDTFSIDGVNKLPDLDDNKYTFSIKSDVTVKVTYAAKKYIVTFKDWDDTVLVSRTVKHGQDATAPDVPARTGYTFTGWDKTFTNVTEDLTVTAQYSIN
ncbi:MAG: InlB B-repeat-containing protein, partial [Candidatus Cloacimonetes bacterium]|nr:InlB B-repeat-containing protein [Candidatus Cloacimonadota bacterium]